MRKLLFVYALIFTPVFFIKAQTVTVNPAEKEVGDIPHKGMSIMLELDDKFVEKAWKKRYKDFDGKTDKEKNAVIIEGASISEVSDNPIRIITIVDKAKGATEVWWAIDKGTEWVTQSSSSYAAASKILKEFGMSAYREDITEQIEEAEKEYEKIVKDFDKMVKEGEDMRDQVKDNKETIEKLKTENEQLEKDIEGNKGEQEALKKDIETMKKKVEETKKKLEMIK